MVAAGRWAARASHELVFVRVLRTAVLAQAFASSRSAYTAETGHYSSLSSPTSCTRRRSCAPYSLGEQSPALNSIVLKLTFHSAIGVAVSSTLLLLPLALATKFFLAASTGSSRRTGVGTSAPAIAFNGATWSTSSNPSISVLQPSAVSFLLHERHRRIIHSHATEEYSWEEWKRLCLIEFDVEFPPGANYVQEMMLNVLAGATDAHKGLNVNIFDTVRNRCHYYS
jgi:hypothetical protein